MSDDSWFERLAVSATGATHDRAPARLKSKIYSALVARIAQRGSLLDLSDTKRAGGRLCVFEQALTILPRSTKVRSMNPCRICHARLLGERMEHAPIFWPGCPYADFHSGQG
jgi:hypothetical protein